MRTRKPDNLQSYDNVMSVINNLEIALKQNCSDSKHKNIDNALNIIREKTPREGESVFEIYNQIMFASKSKGEDDKNEITRLALVVLLYLLKRGSCVFSYEELIYDLENTVNSKYQFIFYKYKSDKVIKSTLLRVLTVVSKVLTIEKEGQDFKYIATDSVFKNFCSQKGNEIYIFLLLDAIINYNHSEKEQVDLLQKILFNSLEIPNKCCIQSISKPRFNHTHKLTNLSKIIDLKDKPIKFKHNYRTIYFKVSRIIENNGQYFIIGTQLLDKYKLINEGNLLSHFSLEEITEIEKSNKNDFDIITWLKENRTKDSLPTVVNKLSRHSILNSKKSLESLLESKIKEYINKNILNSTLIKFEILKSNIQQSLISDMKNVFGNLVIEKESGLFELTYSIDKFIEWALPKYNFLKIRNESICEEIENKIIELYSHINRKAQ